MNRLRVFLHGCAGWFEGGSSIGTCRSRSTRTWRRPPTSTCSRGCHARTRDVRRFAASAASRRRRRRIETCVHSVGWRTRDGTCGTRSERSAGHPASPLVAILTLALAIGVATAIFSVVDAALLRPVPYPKPEEIVTIDVGKAFDQRLGPSATDIEGWRTGTRLRSHRHGEAHRLQACRGGRRRAGTDYGGDRVGGLARGVRVVPILGRGISADDSRPGCSPGRAPRSPLLADALNGAGDVLGRSIRVDGDQATIVGVVPAGFYPEHDGVAPARRALRHESDARDRRRSSMGGCDLASTSSGRARAHCPAVGRRRETRTASVADVAV